MAGKKGHLCSLCLCVSCSVVCLSPSISTRAAALSLQTNSQKEKRLLPGAWILSEMWAGDGGDGISLILAGACLCSWFWTALSHGKRHHELPEAKETLASIPKGIPSHLTHVQCLWHPVACPDLFIYLFYSPLFCLEKTYLFLLPRLRSFFQLLPNSRATGFARFFGGGAIPLPCSLVRLARSQLLGGDQDLEERDAVPQLEGETSGRRCGVWLWGWSTTLGDGFSPGLIFQQGHSPFSHRGDGKGKLVGERRKSNAQWHQEILPGCECGP